MLGNARGTAPSRTHTHLKPNGLRQKQYWSFSWHAIGAVDLPAVIDHILFETKQKKLSYVGHSQVVENIFVQMTKAFIVCVEIVCN